MNKLLHPRSVVLCYVLLPVLTGLLALQLNSAMDQEMPSLIKITPQTVVFENAVPGVELEKSLTVVNSSSEPLRIEAMRLSCGCMQATTLEPVILANESSQIDIKIIRHSKSKFIGTLFIDIEMSVTKRMLTIAVPISWRIDQEDD